VAPDQRLVRIAARLRQRTKAGQQRWQAAPRPQDAGDDWRPRQFQTRLEHGTAIVSSEHPDGRFPYVLRIVDPVGLEAGRLETGEDAESWLGDREADEWERVLAELYAGVRDSTLHSDAAVDAILAELEGPDSEPA
jgi:hypothetical protein